MTNDCFYEIEPDGIDVVPLYTTPPTPKRIGELEWQWGYERGWDAAMNQKREWAGLSVSQSLDLISEYEDRPLELLEAAESILREKNT